MSFLAPLYALGLLGLGVPILLHLIRRQPKGETPFGSLMFLVPTPPPPAQKRKLDQLFLLLARLGALGLLVFAFTRPFFRLGQEAQWTGQERTTLLLIDTSASMRHGAVWQQALDLAQKEWNAAGARDRVALYTFDRHLHPILSLDETEVLETGLRSTVGREKLSTLQPGWGPSYLDQALIESCKLLTTLKGEAKGGTKKLVLISDLAQGTRIQDLTGWELPPEISLDVKQVYAEGGNAGVELLPQRWDLDNPKESNTLRAKVVNDATSTFDAFSLNWSSGKQAPLTLQVPPGESRIVKLEKPAIGLTAHLELKGDGQPYDNSAFLAPRLREEKSVWFLGEENPGDTRGLRFFLESAWAETPLRRIQWENFPQSSPLTESRIPRAGASKDSPSTPPLIIIARETTSAEESVLKSMAESGSTLLWVCPSQSPSSGLGRLLGKSGSVKESPSNRFALFKDIAFGHPLFAPLAGPQFGDFTKIQIWKRRELPSDWVEGGQILARFDDSQPAIMEKGMGLGRLLVLATGWAPADSQLALSTKFFPLMESLLRLDRGKVVEPPTRRVFEEVILPIPPGFQGPVRVRKPEGEEIALNAGQRTFAQTDTPGNYLAVWTGGSYGFAINLDPLESWVSPLPKEQLESLGLKPSLPTSDPNRESQARDIELEKTQSLWRWLILGTLGFLFCETMLAGWMGRQSTSPWTGETAQT